MLRRRRRDGVSDLQPHPDGQQHGVRGQHVSAVRGQVWRGLATCPLPLVIYITTYRRIDTSLLKVI